jgi:hypothetical protein
MTRSRLTQGAAVVTVCAALGAAAGIAGSAAAPTKHSKAAGSGTYPGSAKGPGRPRFAGPPVHSESVVPNQNGGFDTITMDRGAFDSVSGDQLTIKEGTKTATYKTVTLTIPSDATIRRNGAAAKLSDLQSGDEIFVLSGPPGTKVIAADAQHQDFRGGPGFGHRHGGWRHGPGGPGGAGDPGDGPPGPPGAQTAPAPAPSSGGQS